MAQKYGKTFTCRKGKFKGKRVKYLYTHGKKRRMVLASKNRRW